jgi:hypothetical protein
VQSLPERHQHVSTQRFLPQEVRGDSHSLQHPHYQKITRQSHFYTSIYASKHRSFLVTNNTNSGCSTLTPTSGQWLRTRMTPGESADRFRVGCEGYLVLSLEDLWFRLIAGCSIIRRNKTEWYDKGAMRTISHRVFFSLDNLAIFFAIIAYLASNVCKHRRGNFGTWQPHGSGTGVGICRCRIKSNLGSGWISGTGHFRASEPDIRRYRICHIILIPTLEEGEAQRRTKESWLVMLR